MLTIQPDRITVFSGRWCPYCMMAKRLLDKKGVAFDEVMVDRDPDLMHAMMEKTSRRTIPQIFIGTHHVGGYDDLALLESSNTLDALLAPFQST